jgi:hypothetical protein
VIETGVPEFGSSRTGKESDGSRELRHCTHLDIALDDVERRDGGVREPAGRGASQGARCVVCGREHLDLAERLARGARHHRRRLPAAVDAGRRRVEETGEQRLARRHRLTRERVSVTSPVSWRGCRPVRFIRAVGGKAGEDDACGTVVCGSELKTYFPRRQERVSGHSHIFHLYVYLLRCQIHVQFV